MAAKFEIRPVGVGTFSWVLLSQGRILATGEPYSRRAAAEKAVESLRKAAAGATVADLTMRPKAVPAKRTAKAAPPKTAPNGTARPAKSKPARNAAKTAKPAVKAAAKTTGKATKVAKASGKATTKRVTNIVADTKKAAGRTGAAKRTAAPRKTTPRGA